MSGSVAEAIDDFLLTIITQPQERVLKKLVQNQKTLLSDEALKYMELLKDLAGQALFGGDSSPMDRYIQIVMTEQQVNSGIALLMIYNEFNTAYLLLLGASLHGIPYGWESYVFLKTQR
jgi:hypothetical protein